MKKNRLLAIASIVIILVAPGSFFSLHAAEREDRDLGKGAVGDRIVEFVKNAESVGFSGAVLAAKDGKVVAAVGVGSADLAGKKPITPATLFEIASATKQFTAAAILRLEEQGKLDLDDPMAKHLPGIPEDCSKITIRHLVQHTSGIPGTNSSGGGTDLAKVLPLFLRGGPVHKPGTHWEYWNQGYALLSEIIARASGKDYMTYCRKSLFVPSGMKNTCFTGDRAPGKAAVVIGRSSRGQPRSALEHPYGSYGFQYRGMGGAVTTVWDLWRWDRALRDNKVLSKNSTKKLFDPGLKNYALGWYVTRNSRGRLVQSHGGSVRGFVCDVRRYPKENGCLFVLCNRDDVPAYRVAQAVEEILFDDPPTCKKVPQPLDTRLGEAIAGRYEDTKGTAVIVKIDGKVTRAEIHWPGRNGGAGPVTRAVLGIDGKDLVLYEWTSLTRVKFKRKGSGPVDQISIRGRRYSRAR